MWSKIVGDFGLNEYLIISDEQYSYYFHLKITHKNLGFFLYSSK